MSPFVWMFISSHGNLRTRLVDEETITSLIQLEYSGFEGATVPICTFTLQKGHVAFRKGCFIRLSDFRGSDSQAPRALEAIRNRGCGWFFEAAQDEFKKLPGSPVAYWVSERVRRVFEQGETLSSVAKPRVGMRTGDNERFLRQWHEVSIAEFNSTSENSRQASESGNKWFPFVKGGNFRKWFGNVEYVINWENNGNEIKTTTLAKYPQLSWDNLGWKISNEAYYFLPAITWTAVSFLSLWCSLRR